MKLVLSNFIFLIVIFFGCKTTIPTFKASNPIEELTVELFEVIKKKDFNAFEKLMPGDMRIRKFNDGIDKTISFNTEERKKIFDSFYEKNINWEKMNIKKVSYSERGTEILKHAEVTINFGNKKNACTMFFPNWLKPEKDKWKIGGLPPEIICSSK